MSTKSMPYYSIVCDEPGCGASHSDLGSEYSAWGDSGAAADDWIAYDGQITPDGDYCPNHRKPQCDECDKVGPVNDEDLCPACTEESA